MNEKINNLNRYLNNEEIRMFKQIIIEALLDVTDKTELGYYYNFSKISNIINTKIEKIFVTGDDLAELTKIQGNTLILNKVFANINFSDKKQIIDFISKEKCILIKIKETGLKIIASKSLNPNFKEALAIYFSSNQEKTKESFYDRKYYTGLPFMDLKEKIISSLNIFVNNETLAQTLSLGDLNLSNKIDQISNHHGTLKTIVKYLDRINMIQLKISNCNLRYAQTENLYYQVLNKINNLRKENIDIEKLIEEIYNMNYDKLNLDKETQKKLISTIRIYDLYNISSSEKEKILNDPFNYKNENKNFIEKLKIILEQIKEETSKTLILLDKEYIKLNDYIVNNLLSKYLKNQKTTEEELINIFQNFEYEIDDDYSYLEKSKATKKLKKKLGKNQ
jgi:predicted DNA-binding ribbon-helix-helix protein